MYLGETYDKLYLEWYDVVINVLVHSFCVYV